MGEGGGGLDFLPEWGGRSCNEAQSDEKNVWDYRDRVEVAIVIPADWSDHERGLRPSKSCRLVTQGKFPPIASLSCRAR
jgi:hypothetical protein